MNSSDRHRGRIARPRGHRRRGRMRPAERRAGQGRPRPAVELDDEGGEGHLRQAAEGRGQLRGRGVGADPPDQPHRDAVASRLGVDEDPVLVARRRVAAELLADEHVAFEDPFGERRRFDRHRPDLRRRRAADGLFRPLAELGVRAGLQAVRGGGVEADAGRQRQAGFLRVGRLLGSSPPVMKGTETAVVAPEGESVAAVCGSSAIAGS